MSYGTSNRKQKVVAEVGHFEGKIIGFYRKQNKKVKIEKNQNLFSSLLLRKPIKQLGIHQKKQDS